MEIDLYSQKNDHGISKKEYLEILIKKNYERKLDSAFNLPWSFNRELRDTDLDDISAVRECFDENRYLKENLTVKKAIDKGLVASAWHHWLEFGRIQRRFAKFNLPFEVINNNNYNQDLYILIDRNSISDLPKELFNTLVQQTTLGFETLDLINPFNYLLVSNLRNQLISAKLAPTTTSVIYLKPILDPATSLNTITLRHINLNYDSIFSNRGLPHYLVEPHSPIYGENIVYASMHLSVVMGSKRIILIGDLEKDNDETIFLKKIISDIKQHNIHVISTDENSSFSKAGATYISLENLLRKSPPRKKIVKESYIHNDGYDLEQNNFFISKASGSHLYDSSGIKYIDTAMAAGSALLGHAHEGLKETISNALTKGSLFCKPTTSGIILGNRLKDIFPWFSGFALCNTGSEATMRLIRIARNHSHKKKIALFAGSWHGTHDFLLVDDKGSNTSDKPEAFLRSAGSPEELLDLIILLPFNSEAAFNKIQQHKDEIAVVITEPIQGSNPKESDIKFMRDLRKVTQENNVLLAFDEIITGGRLGLGGFQKRYKIHADLASYGKIFGGGLPFGFIGAIWGHYAWGVPLSMFSVIGLIGMTGIIINDSIILISTIDEYSKDRGVIPSIIDATVDRLRAVLLTTLTTVIGLMPLLYEASRDAQFLKPTVITLVYGLGFGFFIVLFLVPAFVAIQLDFYGCLRSLRRLSSGKHFPRRIKLYVFLSVVLLLFSYSIGFGTLIFNLPEWSLLELLLPNIPIYLSSSLSILISMGIILITGIVMFRTVFQRI